MRETSFCSAGSNSRIIGKWWLITNLWLVLVHTQNKPLYFVFPKNIWHLADGSETLSITDKQCIMDPWNVLLSGWEIRHTSSTLKRSDSMKLPPQKATKECVSCSDIINRLPRTLSKIHFYVKGGSGNSLSRRRILSLPLLRIATYGDNKKQAH